VFIKEGEDNISMSTQMIYLQQEQLMDVHTDELLRQYKASGPDDICPRLLWELYNKPSYPLTLIFRNHWKQVVPEDWQATVYSC
jgi:hypothetical protein